jgi:CRISPR-associated protein Cmr1
MRLDRWADGELKKGQWPSDVSVTHPEVKNREGNLVPVGNALYLGFGPLVYDNQRRATTLKGNAAIQAGETATLSIAIPSNHKDVELARLLESNVPRIERALWLMDRYGTLGGRSRNGWGSFSLTPYGDTPALRGAVPLRKWTDALNDAWPHAIGQDGKGLLVWQTAPFTDWKQLMREMAIIKIGLRTQFGFSLDATAGDRQTQRGINHAQPQNRHWLSYPVTNHDVSPWKRQNARLPNSLRFKVRSAPNDPRQVVGVIFHVPCLPPSEFRPEPRAIENVWQRVYAFLDVPAQKLTRIPE